MENTSKFQFVRHASNENLNQLVELFIQSWNDASDFIETMTSGSTGEPKLIRLLKKHMVRSAENTLNFLNVKTGGTSLLCLSPETIAGKMVIVRSIVGKMKLIIGDLSANPLKNCNEHIDLMSIVPLQLQSICLQDPEKLLEVKNCIVGGAPVSEKTMESLIKNKISLYHSYGMTETISHIALRVIGYEGKDFFQALPNVDLKTIDNHLIINSPEIGVKNLKTNDCVELISSNQFKWLGRSDFVINSGGIKIHPEHIEQLLSKVLPLPFFVYGLADERLGQRLVLIIESECEMNLDLAAIKSQLPIFHFPKEIYYLSSFVRTKSGKINRLETIKLITDNVIRQVL